MYLADRSEPQQQRRYLFQGGLVILLIGSLVITALAVS
ncbi:MAG: hypothetical protein AAF959_04460 [Cyanobacteria bacterium P01_D01_bin.56]